MAHNYPFGYLCPPGSYTVTLALDDQHSMNDDWLIAPGATPATPHYHFYYSPRKKDGSYKVTVEQLAQGWRTVGTVTFPSEDETDLEFPWLNWDCSLVPDSNDRWSSDVGTLKGHDMEWRWMGWYPDGFGIRCFDVEDAFSNVSAVIMNHWRAGRIEIPVHSIRDQNGLDEMVTVAMVAMHKQRELVKHLAHEGWDKPGGPKRPASASSSSSSSSSSAASNG